MLTEYRRQDLETIQMPAQLKERFKDEDRDSVYPMMVGWMENQQKRLVENMREALDEIDRLKARLDELESIAESEIGTDDGTAYAEYWDKHYED